ncbi:MAG: S-methyl-5-thioribose-1-phosphate isomerase [Polyangiaceae bacterium]|nr:S-methyl-5-thioribose-1-phosphate isomerase [Polyangiaceae bacterium]
MRVAGKSYRTIWVADDGRTVEVIDQTLLPDRFLVAPIRSTSEMATAIRTMVVRGAPLIGVAGAYGLALAATEDSSDERIDAAHAELLGTRPTAVNLAWALDRVRTALREVAPGDRPALAYELAAEIADQDVAACAAIGEHGARLLRAEWERRGRPEPFHILTHCNAGWLATVDHGTALSPVYRLFDEGVPVHVWVDETRPRNQGQLTYWELAEHGVPCTFVADNAGGLLMQRGKVHAAIVGSDRTVRNGDVCNKIGTYLKALAAKDAGVPFYVALPSSTLDFALADGNAIVIEERAASEVTERAGVRVANPAFDVTPARFVTAIVTEKGACEASESGLATLHPELVATGTSRAGR